MGYSVYEADLIKDKKKILDFWRENHTRPLDSKFMWMYEKNPSGQAKIWLLEHTETGECSGMLAIFPREIRVRGEITRGWVTGDFFVKKQVRILGPALMLQKCVIPGIENGHLSFCYGFPNKSAEPVMKRVGYEKFASGTKLVKIIKTSRQLRKLGFPDLLIRLISPLLDLTLKLLSLETWYRFKAGLVCEKIDCVDERFSRFWEERRHDFELAGERGLKYLHWKFCEDPDDDNYFFTVSNSNNAEIRGYIVFRYQNKVIDIRDLLCPKDRKTTMILFSSFLRYARLQNAAAIQISMYTKRNNFTGMLRNFGFYRENKDGRNVLTYCSKQFKERLTKINDSGNWFLFQFDEDT